MQQVGSNDICGARDDGLHKRNIKAHGVDWLLERVCPWSALDFIRHRRSFQVVLQNNGQRARMMQTIAPGTFPVVH